MALGLGSMMPFLKPVSDWVDPRRNALMGFSAGAFSGDMGKAMQYAMAGRATDQQYMLDAQERAREEQERNATAEWLKQNYPQFANLPPAQGFDAAMKMLAQAQSGAGDALKTVGGHLYDVNSGEWISPPATDNRQNISLQGQWGQDAQGNPVFLQPSSTGEMIPAQVPEGVKLMSPFDLNAQRAGGSAFGKQTGAAQFDVPAVRLMADQTQKAIQDIRAEKKGMEEQFGNILGIPQQMTPAIPSSDKAKFQVAVQRATDRAFLEARELLRGGGQITDFESRKAETAITSMQLAMEKGDKAQFEKALADFEQAVKDGVAKLEQQAGAMPGYGGGASAPTGNTTSSGVSWSVEP